MSATSTELYSKEARESDAKLAALRQPRTNWLAERLRKRVVNNKNRSGHLQEHTAALEMDKLWIPTPKPAEAEATPVDPTASMAGIPHVEPAAA